MEFDRKFELAKKELVSKGIWNSTSGNWIYHLLQSVGLKLRPLYYCRFYQMTLRLGFSWGVPFGLIAWFFLIPEDHALPSIYIIFILFLAGLAYGLAMSVYFTRHAKKKNLSNWEAL